MSFGFKYKKSATDELFTLTTAGTAFTGIRKAPSTVHSWIRQGLRTRDGRVVKLAAIRVGRDFRVRRSDLTAFVEAVAA